MTERLKYLSIVPDAMKAIGGVYHYVSQSGLPKDLVELVYLRVSLINGCAYCNRYCFSCLERYSVVHGCTGQALRLRRRKYKI